MTNYCSRLLGLPALDSARIEVFHCRLECEPTRSDAASSALQKYPGHVECLHSAMTNAERIFRHVESYFKACHSPLMPTRSEHSFEIFVNFNSSMTKRILFSTNYDEKRSRLAEHERKSSLIIETAVFFVRPRVCDKYAFNQRHHIRITRSATAETLHAFRFASALPSPDDNRFLWSVAPRNVGDG